MVLSYLWYGCFVMDYGLGFSWTNLEFHEKRKTVSLFHLLAFIFSRSIDFDIYFALAALLYIVFWRFLENNLYSKTQWELLSCNYSTKFYNLLCNHDMASSKWYVSKISRKTNIFYTLRRKHKLSGVAHLEAIFLMDMSYKAFVFTAIIKTILKRYGKSWVWIFLWCIVFTSAQPYKTTQ